MSAPLLLPLNDSPQRYRSRGNGDVHRFPSLQREWAQPFEASVSFGLRSPSTFTLAQSTFNLTETLVGPGMLSLSYAVAAGTGLFPATMIIIVLGAYSGFQFTLLARICEAETTRTFHELGLVARCQGFAAVLDFLCTFKMLFGCLSLSIVITDCFADVFRSLGVPGAFCSRTVVLLGMTWCILLPLCLLRNLSHFSCMSLLRLAGMLFVTCFMIVRYFDGTYSPDGGKYFKVLAPQLQPSFGASTLGHVSLWTVNIKSLVLMCIVSHLTAAHYSVPKLYDQLQDQHFNVVSIISFSINIVCCIVVMCVGYLTFGVHSQGLILNNYSNSDTFATAARIVLGVSAICSYPLVFAGFRDGVMVLCEIEPDFSEITAFTGVLLAMITTIVHYVTNFAFVVDLSGAIFGSAIIYSIPAFLFLFASRKAVPTNAGGACTPIPEHRERKLVTAETSEQRFQKATIGFGMLLALLGSTIAVLQEYAPRFLTTVNDMLSLQNLLNLTGYS